MHPDPRHHEHLLGRVPLDRLARHTADGRLHATGQSAEHAPLVHHLMTTGLLHGIRQPPVHVENDLVRLQHQLPGETRCSARHWEQTSAVMNDLAYSSMGIGRHTDNPYRDPMPDSQRPHQIDGCDGLGQFDAQRRPQTVARYAMLKSISQTA